MFSRFCVCPVCKRAVVWRSCRGGAGELGRPVFHVNVPNSMGRRCEGRHETVDLSDTYGSKAAAEHAVSSVSATPTEDGE